MGNRSAVERQRQERKGQARQRKGRDRSEARMKQVRNEAKRGPEVGRKNI